MTVKSDSLTHTHAHTRARRLVRRPELYMTPSATTAPPGRRENDVNCIFFDRQRGIFERKLILGMG